MENRHGLLVDFRVTKATGTPELDVIPNPLDEARARGFRPRTLEDDRGYDTRDRVADMQARDLTPHVAHKQNSAIDVHTTRHADYRVNQRKRKLAEEIFGWMKTEGGFWHTRYRGVVRTGLAGYLVATAYNPARMANLGTGLPPRVAPISAT